MPLSINNQTSSSSSGSLKNLEGAVLGAGAVIGASIALHPILKAGTTKMRSYSNNLTDDEIKQVKINAYTVLRNTGLQDKGVTINWYTDNALKEAKEKAKTIRITSFKTFKEKLKLVIASKPKGLFSFKQNKVNMLGKGSTLSVFHEMGHAMNKHFGKLAKIAQKSRLVKYLSLPIALYALFKPSKAKIKKENKEKDFIKNNVGKLTFATFIPILYEEGRASIRGWKEAKKVLSPELYAKTVKQGKFGFLSYLYSAIFSSLGIYAACKIKDSFINKNPN